VFGLVLLGGSAAIVYGLGKADGCRSISRSCDRFALHLVLLVAAPRVLHEPGASPRGNRRIHLLRVGDGWAVRGYKRALVSPFSAYLLMAIGALGTGFFLLSQVNKSPPARYGEGAHGRSGLAQALGIWTVGAGRPRW